MIARYPPRERPCPECEACTAGDRHQLRELLPDVEMCGCPSDDEIDPCFGDDCACWWQQFEGMLNRCRNTALPDAAAP
jgi:hypothetical protein